MAPWTDERMRLKVSKVGLRAFHRVGAFIRPSTKLVQLFGSHAVRCVVHLEMLEVARLLAGERIPVDFSCDKGYVILCLGASPVLGLGFFKDGFVTSQLPGKRQRAPVAPPAPRGPGA